MKYFQPHQITFTERITTAWTNFVARPYWQIGLISIALLILLALTIWALVDLERYLREKRAFKNRVNQHMNKVEHELDRDKHQK
jgi:hypothetical protein